MRWLGFDWGAHLYHASDYFDRLYEFARHLIKAGLAYVDSSIAGRDAPLRGTLTEPGQRQPVPRPLASRKISICSGA